MREEKPGSWLTTFRHRVTRGSPYPRDKAINEQLSGLKMSHKTRFIVLYCLLLSLPVAVSGEPEHVEVGKTYPDGSPEQQVWSLEKEIYRERAKGNRAHYPSLISEYYLGWPASVTDPIAYADLMDFRERGEFPPGEVIKVWSNGISIDGDTAISYFSTHRTRKAGGEPVDQRYENIHVWVLRAGEWRLLGSKSRRLVQRDTYREN